jgi:hypothetical protein
MAAHADTQPCILFVHVPKTSGTSFRSELFGILNRSETRYGLVTRLPNPEGVVAGHWSAAVMREAQYATCKAVTVLRDPVDRVVSCYRYHGHANDNQAWQACLDRAPSCQRDSPSGQWSEHWLSNAVMRQLSGRGVHWNMMVGFATRRSAPNAALFLPETTLAREIDDYYRDDGSGIWAEHWAAAVEHLSRFHHVCFMDALEQCLSVLAADFDSPLRAVRASKNVGGDPTHSHVTHKAATVPATVVARLHVANAHDRGLWRLARDHCHRASRRCNFPPGALERWAVGGQGPLGATATAHVRRVGRL